MLSNALEKSIKIYAVSIFSSIAFNIALLTKIFNVSADFGATLTSVPDSLNWSMSLKRIQ